MWTSYVPVGDERKLRIRAIEWSRRGFPCVLVHGFGENSAVWSDLAPRLMPQFRVIAIDLRGHGDSDWDPLARYDGHAGVSDLAQIVAEFGFERTILVGHSWGAEAAIRYAAKDPQKVAALVIVDFGPDLAAAGVDEVLKGFSETPRIFASTDEYVQWLTSRRPLAKQKLLEQFARHSLRRSAGGQYELKTDPALGTESALSRLTAENGRYSFADLWTALPMIRCPCLVVRGAASGVLPADVAARMVDRISSGSRLQSIGAAGHAVMMDNPEEFSRSVVAFLTKAMTQEPQAGRAPRAQTR